MHAYVAHNATVCMLVWQTKHYMHASVADIACVAEYATACIHVWQIMHMYSCRCGTYSVCSSVCDCTHTCVADYAHVFMPVWHIQRM